MKNRMVDNCDIFYHFVQCLAYEREEKKKRKKKKKPFLCVEIMYIL